MKKLFLVFAAVVALGLAACGPGASTSPTFPVTTLGPTLAPIETPMTTAGPSESPMSSEAPSPSTSATP